MDTHSTDRKKMKRIKRRRRRQRIARLLLFLFLFFGLGAASVDPESNLLVQVTDITEAYQFDFIDWESQALASELGRRLATSILPASEVEQRALVDTYLELEQQIRDLERDIDSIFATAADRQEAAFAAADLEQELAHIRAAQAAIAPQVETVLSRQIEMILRDEGFVVANQVFPPVALRLVDPPTALILSPRDKIENQHFIGLQPGLENSRRADIEDQIDGRGDVSSYVTNLGGLGSYPTMVINTPNLPVLIDIAAHEWTHNYLFTFPTNIAWGYQTYPRLTTINETTATLVGQEISRQVISRYYPDWADQLPPADDEGVPVSREPSEFDLAMRRIRTQVDELLAEGKIGEAETYMEAERLKLVDKGYNLRKLNQAYFAFHGSYAFGPDSVDPTGSQIRDLRAASPSLKAFLDTIGWLNSYDDYWGQLNEAGIE